MIFIGIGLALGYMIGVYHKAGQTTKLLEEMREFSVANNVGASYAALKLIHDGHIDKVTCFLETSLKSAVQAAENEKIFCESSTNNVALISKAKVLLDDRNKQRETNTEQRDAPNTHSPTAQGVGGR